MAEPPINRTEQAYRHLTREILRGRWEEGASLSTYDLAKELGISRTPIVGALKRLESEGLVEIIPQVGSRVVGATSRSLQELLGLRAAVEGLAAEAAAARIGDAELDELGGLVQRIEQAIDQGDREACEELDATFHRRVTEASGLPHLIHAGRSAWAPLRYQLARLPDEAVRPAEAIPEHREIYEALRRRTPKRARAAAERHAALSAARLREHDPGGLRHGALIYSADDDFLAGAAPFAEEGLDADERVLAVTTDENIELLRRALGPRADEVEFRRSREWYFTPSHTVLAYERYVAHADRARVRILGEPVWDQRSSAAITEWTRYESILNVELALAPVTILCPYDARELPDAVMGSARATHPDVQMGGESERSSEFKDVRTLSRELDAGPLDDPVPPVAEHAITADLRDARDFALEQGRRAGLSPKRLVDALLAVEEAVANVATHGPGRGTLRSWVYNHSLVYEIRDDGPGLADALVGHMTLDPALRGEPRGLWIARLLCDLVEVRSAGRGLTVRLHLALD
jgi:DNA-binding GntR family transcriptional regulator/anti-sigma regulatory factor (Ser/Thr protein kinase)